MNLLKECEGAKRIGISGHIRPDGDCVGSCLALYLYLKKNMPEAVVAVYLEQPADIFGEISGFENIVSTFPEEEKFDVYFVLDSMPDRIGDAVKYYEAAAKKINIDHHISNQGCGDVFVVRPEVGSACEVLYDLMEPEKLDKEIAMALYIGIIHDTGVFQYSNTTPDTLRKAAHLIGFGFDFPRLIEETFYQKTYLQTQLMGRVLAESNCLMNGQCTVGVADRRTMELYGATAKDLDGIVNQLRNVKGAHCAVFMYELADGEFKISMRSDEKVNVAEVASHFDGGGHMRAAGCTIKGDSAECLKQVMKYIGCQLGAAEGLPG